MEKDDTLLQVHLQRPIYEQEALNDDYQYERPTISGIQGKRRYTRSDSRD